MFTPESKQCYQCSGTLTRSFGSYSHCTRRLPADALNGSKATVPISAPSSAPSPVPPFIIDTSRAVRRKMGRCGYGVVVLSR
jgi:hypothetical protein